MKSPRLLFSLLLLFCAASSFCQEEISRKPVRSTEEIRARLFDLPETDSAVFIRVDLPNEEYLTLEMKSISAWKPGSFPDIVTVANQVYNQLRDSFTDATASRRLAIRIPEKGSILTQLSESGGGKKTLAINGAQIQAVRVATDTLTVLQKHTDDKNESAVLYTFLLKDLADINDLAKKQDLVQHVSGVVDSLVETRRRKWKNPDARTHLLLARYDLSNGAEGSGKLTLGERSTIGDNIHYGANLGISFLAGNIATFIDYKLSYQWPRHGSSSMRFVALSYSTNILYKEANATIEGRALQFLNAEVGTSFGNNKDGQPLYNTSLGFGYRLIGYNVGPYDYRYRFFFNYSLSPAITVTPDFYFTGRKLDNSTPNNVGSALGGITLTVRLF